MAIKLIVLGAGTGGTAVANRLRRMIPESEVEITVIDRDSHHLYQPGLLFMPFDRRRTGGLARNRWAQLNPGISWAAHEVDHVDVDACTVAFRDGTTAPYDVLVIASGARLLPDETEGLTGPGWGEKVFTFYAEESAAKLAAALDVFAGGHIVVNVVDMPIKCPVAPLEFCFLADDYFRRRGIRDQVRLTYATPLDAAFTKPVAAAALGDLLRRKGIEIVTEFTTASVDGMGGRLSSYDGRSIDFDLGVVVPLHGGAEFVGRSPGLGDALDFVITDPKTLQAKVAPNVFALGDATDLSTSKAGSVAHFESEIVAANVASFIRGEPLEASYDGHANCFVETGDGKALLIDFNSEVEPVPGHFPGRVGLPLLRESRLNHIAKLAFERVYWDALLPARRIPGITSTMPMAGKDLAALHRKDAS